MKKLDMYVAIPCKNELHQYTGAYQNIGIVYLPRIFQWCIRGWLWLRKWQFKLARNGGDQL